MYSVWQQDKTPQRDGRGMTIYRRLYLCDSAADLAELPTDDAPGSAVVVADGGGVYLLDHRRTWCAAGQFSPGAGGGLWTT